MIVLNPKNNLNNLFIMSKTYIYFIFIAFLPLFSNAQSEVPPIDSAKYRKANTIFQAIKKAWANEKNIDYLKLDIIPYRDTLYQAGLQGAWTNGKTVYLRENFYDICVATSNPEGALALILGHEIAHCVKKHPSQTIICNVGGKSAVDPKVLEDTKQHEQEADRLGYLYARIAGYTPSYKDTQVIEVLYDKYKLPTESVTHPSLEQRIALAQQDYKAAEEAYYQYEHGLIAYILNDYLFAAEDFYSIRHSYEIAAPEVLNNEAVCLLNVLCRFKDDSLHQQVLARLKADGFLKNANEHYKGITREGDYQNLLIKLCGLYKLDNNENSDSLRCEVILALADTLLQKGLKMNPNNPTILQNKKLIENIKNGKSLENIQENKDTIKSYKNTIEVPKKIIAYFDITKDLTYLTKGTNNEFRYKEREHHLLQLKRDNFHIIIAETNYNEELIKEIKIGNSQNDLEQKYGKENYKIETNYFDFLIYNNGKIIFKIDNKSKNISSIIFVH